MIRLSAISPLRRCLLLLIVALLGVSHCSTLIAADRVEFTRLLCHWSDYGRPDYLSFIEDAQPEIVQVGEYGAHFWSVAHTPFGKGYPAHFPVEGLKQQGEWFEILNRELHRKNVKVIGHFNCKFLVGDPEGPDGATGFFKFYKNLWDVKELGPKPVKDAIQLLEVDGEGKPIVNHSYSIGKMAEYWGCLVNPHWRTVLKAWAKRGIERGVDGFMVNYFYRHNCLCEHCQSGFKQHLRERYSADQLKSKYAIDNLDGHKFTEIVGWHKPDESTPLRREMLAFSQIVNKKAIDEVLVEYGRSIKPDLIVAQWDHISNFSAISGDERCLLPKELWGKDEDYLWYSGGASAFYTDLKEKFLGDVTLQCRYIRGAFDDKPFTIGKYESTRTRSAIAELAANGGAPMGFYTTFRDQAARDEIVRYYQFLKRYDNVYRANKSHGEVLLLFPRTAIHDGRLDVLERFRQTGRKLLDDHVLFDVLPDDLFNESKAKHYRAVINLERDSSLSADVLNGLSRFEVPQTVRVSASRPREGKEIAIHYVNYNRIEPEKPKSAGTGIADEKPIAAKDLKGDVVLPEGWKLERVECMTPEQPTPIVLSAQEKNGRVSFTMPEALVYGVVRIIAKP